MIAIDADFIVRRLYKSGVCGNVLLNSALFALPPADLTGEDGVLGPCWVDCVEGRIEAGCTSFRLLIETFLDHIDVANGDRIGVVPFPHLTDSNIVLIHL